MKFIKEYKIFEAIYPSVGNLDNSEEIKDMFESKINRNAINNIKDMSLEYLDMSLRLEISIHVIFPGNIDVSLCYLTFSHDEEKENWHRNNIEMLKLGMMINKKYKIKYSISLSTPGGRYAKEAKELRQRIKEAYPEILLTTY